MGFLRALPKNPAIRNCCHRFPLPVWRKELNGYHKYNHIINGLSEGFHIGVDSKYKTQSEKISSKPCFIPLDPPEKQAITDWVTRGVRRAYICGPYTLDYNFPWDLKCAPFFVIPKPEKGKYRPIVHLSWTAWGKFYSVNDLIVEHMRTVKYITLREVVELINSAGKDAHVFVVDAQDAYYRVPIHPDDFQYMGLKWLKQYWVFTSLQMGCASSPKIYTEFADAIEWIIVNRNRNDAFKNGYQIIRHYLDDFFGVHQDYQTAVSLFNEINHVMDILGVPTKLSKCFAPHWEQKILGRIYNTKKRSFKPQPCKREEYLLDVQHKLKTTISDKKSLERTRGRLGNIAEIVFPGKAFLRRLDAILHLPGFEYNVPISLSSWVLEDLRFWEWLLSDEGRTEVSFDLFLKKPDDADFKIFTDATTEWGCGGYCEKYGFQIDWNSTELKNLKMVREVDIQLLELLTSIIATELWSDKFVNKSVTLYNDNPGAAYALATKAPRLYRLDMNFLIIYLAKLAIDKKFKFWGVHCIDDRIDLADGLSRLKQEQKYKFGNNLIDCSNQALAICNKLMRRLMLQPLNLPSKKDISQELRSEMGILYNEGLYQNEKMERLFQFKELMKYNILEKK